MSCSGNREAMPVLNPKKALFEGTAVYQINKNRFYFPVSASVYSRFIHNWILCLPGGGGNPSPENVEQIVEPWHRNIIQTAIHKTEGKMRGELFERLYCYQPFKALSFKTTIVRINNWLYTTLFV